MNIENEGLLFMLDDPFDGIVKDPFGNKPEVSATADWPRNPKPPNG